MKDVKTDPDLVGLCGIKTMVDPIHFETAIGYNSCVEEWLYWNAQPRNAAKSRYPYERQSLDTDFSWLAFRAGERYPISSFYRNSTLRNHCHRKINLDFDDPNTSIADKNDIINSINTYCYAIGLKSKYNTVETVLNDINDHADRTSIASILNISYYKTPPILLAIILIASFYALYITPIPFIFSSIFVFVMNLSMAFCAYCEYNLLQEGPFSHLTQRDYSIQSYHRCFEFIRTSSILMLIINWVLLDQYFLISHYLCIPVLLCGFLMIAITQFKNQNNINFRRMLGRYSATNPETSSELRSSPIPLIQTQAEPTTENGTPKNDIGLI